MKTKIFKNANYIGWIVIILIFVFIYFSYFFIYIPNKESQLQQKGFRILKEYGSNMLDKHKYFENHFKNYGLFYSIKFLTDSTKISRIDTNLIDKEYRKKSEEINNVIKGLQQYVITTKDSKDSAFFYKGKKKELLLSFHNKNTEKGLTKSLKRFYKSTNDNISIESILVTDFSHNVPINDFMDKLKFDELFENIILFDNSNVSYNSNLGNLADITNPEALCDSAGKTQGGIYKTLNIRGQDKHFMILPIDFAGKPFYIAGIISDTDYHNKTRTINKQLLIFIAGFLLLIFAGMPILKIIFIDDRERLKASDASNSGVSLLFGIGLFILIIVAFSKKQIIDQTIQDRRIKMISEKLYSNVLNDIDSLKMLGSSFVTGSNSQYTLFADSVCDLFYSPVSFFQDSTLSRPFPLNEIILMDKNGVFTKGYTRTAFSDIVKIDLSDRQYFKNIKDINNSWPTSDSLRLNFYIESIKSLNTGAVETAISFHTTNFDSLPVLAITSKIPSLYQQVLPKDIEFVIINKKGKVLYHSIEEKNLHENFVFECESDLQLVNAINTCITDVFQIHYNEKKWLARIKPIKDTPLYHITLLDLNQADNKNARIFLLTFYFLIATLIFIVVGLLIMRWITFSDKSKQNNTWFLNWLVFRSGKYLLYKRLSIVLIVIILVQLSGFFIEVKPVTILFYQLILIVYSLFATMVFLNRSKLNTEKSFRYEFFTELNVLLATVLLILFFLWKFDSSHEFRFQLLFLIILTIYFTWFLTNYNPEKEENKTSIKQDVTIIKRSYLIFLLLWLTSISAVPVIIYYYSIRKQEEELWKKEQTLKVACDNIELQTTLGNPDKEWFKRIQGNGIDSINVSYFTFDRSFVNMANEDSENVNYSEKIYYILPDPVTSWYNQPKLTSQNNYINTLYKNDTLFYKKGLKTGAILVTYPNGFQHFSNLKNAILIFCILVFIGICVWFLLKYLASVLLSLNQEKPAVSEISWIEILKNKEVNRILLNSFDGLCFLEKSQEIAKAKDSGIKEIKTLPASQIIASDFKIESLPSDPKKIIWICRFNKIINDFDKHETLLSNLYKLNETSSSRIIVDLSFDIGLINEFLDDYIASAELKPEQLTNIFLLRKKWMNLFNDYYSFNGYLSQNSIIDSGDNGIEEIYRTECVYESSDFRFSGIWNNLTSYEKIVLFDLADDGLMNRKNKGIIQKLIDKRLIVTDPVPAFSSDEFRDFVRKNIKSTEVKAIEKKLGLKGSWHNAKYLILLILIPLAAFIVISQGISIEKVFGIFAGGLAIITGILRLLDTNVFRQT